MAFDKALAKRIRAALGKREDVVEKEMFGGLAFMTRGRMSCGIVGSSLMVRIDPEQEGRLLKEPGARPMDFTGRPMRGFLFVDPPGIASAAALRRWVDRATAHAEATPRKGARRPSSGSPKGKSPSRLIDERIEELGDWRGKTLSRLRKLIKEADPGVVEEWKWGVPVWSHDGLICTGETYKSTVKMTFARGAALEDPSGLFNSSLEGKTRRAIDFREGEKIDEKALKALIRSAATLNASRVRG